MRTNYLTRAEDIHQRNIDAGWWKQSIYSEHPGSACIYQTEPRNIGELLCLVHSEIDEAYDGHVYGKFDDHLPTRLMAQVEMADTAIRVFDILGYYKSKLRFTELCDPFDFPQMMELKFAEICMVWHSKATAAMESFRKCREDEGVMHLWHLLDCLYHVAYKFAFNLDDVIDEKLAYNAQRADHKLENRAKDGGKKF